VTQITESAEVSRFNRREGGTAQSTTKLDEKMLTSIIVTAVIAGALGYALRQGRRGRDDDLIVHRPYNNRYDDASGARDYALFE
jgi:hypothetical protein